MTGLAGNVDKLYSDGLHVGGDRFVLTKAEERSLYARKVSTLPQLRSHVDVQPWHFPYLRCRVLSISSLLILVNK